MTTWHYQAVTMSDCESQEAMMTPFLQSFDELAEVINRLERDGICKEDVKFARRKLEDLCLELNLLILGKVKLEKWLKPDAEKASE